MLTAIPSDTALVEQFHQQRIQDVEQQRLRRRRQRSHTLEQLNGHQQPLARQPRRQAPASLEPLAFQTRQRDWKPLDLGRMNVQCIHCQALHWADERISNSSRNNPRFESCCKKGDLSLDHLPAPPTLLKELLEASSIQARSFRQHIRQYNSTLTFTSINYKSDNRQQQFGELNSFQIHGEFYHLQGPLQPANNHQPQYAQLFFYDPAYATEACQRRNLELDDGLLQQLLSMLHACNPFIQVYLMANERLQQAQDEDVHIMLNPQMRLVMEAGSDQRRTNLPTSDEVAVIITDKYEERSFQDLLLAKRTAGEEQPVFTRIEPHHPAYMPLHYVLLFPLGTYGFHWALRLWSTRQARVRTRVGQRVFYRYWLHQHQEEHPTIFLACRLFQQYVVDAWATCDQDKLKWIQRNQDTFRADLYQGLADTLLQSDVDLANTG